MNNRDYYRRIFSETWKKYSAGILLSDLEKQLIQVILQHPEYHPLLENPDFTSDFDLDQNPYLHLGLHVGLLEQLSTERPPGINAIYKNLLAKIGETHETEHQIMNVMAELIWSAQKNGSAPSDVEYLEKLLENVK